MIANPTKKEFAGMVLEKLLTNRPITICNIDKANQIFGPNLASLRGKTMRVKPDQVRVKYARIPNDFIQLHKYVMLVADVMFVEKNRPWARGLRVMRLKTIGRGRGGHPWWAQPLFVMIK
jgi:hypothetical protein